MKTIFYMNNRKVSKKSLVSEFGESWVAHKVEEAKEGFFEDPLEMQSWYLGGKRELVICFE